MSQPTHEQVNLMLKLYELRREPRLRQARAWFFENFNVTSPDELLKKYPQGSEENTSIRMVISYWDMVASIANRGLMDEELFFETTGEIWVVWERLRALAPAWRTAFKSPYVFANLEETCKRMDAWREKRAPGSTAAMRQMMEQMARATAKTAAAE
ncbi:MAG: hypothetical protein HY237_11245 [Acidobacteria bacterium]|nr:hypothetical protein [Acidobacteriota bacterium]